MSIGDLQDWLLTMVVTYGALALAAALFLGGLGLPLPSTLMVVAGGAFVQQGVLDLAPALALALVGVVLGDTLSYGIGRALRGPINRRYGQAAPWLQAEAYFNRRGGLAVYLTRCLLTAIALPINLVAGGSGYPLRRFLAYDALGELTWLVAYGALGYVFGSQWEAVSDLASDFGGVLAGALIAGAGVYALVRWQRRPATELQST